MFSNRIERLGHKKITHHQQQQTKKNQGKNKQTKNGNNSTHHEPLSEEWMGILNSPPDKFLIPVYQIYLYATLPPRGLYRP